MPVTGLPAAVESALTALLTCNSVRSWKISGEGQNTVVVLRLQPATVSTNMAEPVLNRSTQVQYLRKKAPSQRRRDQERMRQRRLEKENADRSECVNDVVKAPHLADTVREKQHSTDSDTQYTSTHNTEQNEDMLGVSCLGLTLDSNTSASPQPPDIDSKETTDSTVKDLFGVDLVQDYVNQLTDSSVQRRLKNRNRNKTFHKVTVQHSDSGDVVLCDSDDIVLEYICDQNILYFTYWLIKQKQNNMLPEERMKLSSLQKGEHISTSQHIETRTQAESDLQVLCDIIRDCLT